MARPLKILLAEDSSDDAELLMRSLRKGGFEPEYERVASAQAMNVALDKGGWDVVISDYVMPGFGGLEALALFKQKDLDIPFIILSGHVGEDLAVAAIKAGASDYLMKDRMTRLVPAVERALVEANIRRAHQRTNDAFRESEERFRQLAENIGAVFFMFDNPQADHPGKLTYVSPAFQKLWGYPADTLTLDSALLLKTVHPQDSERVWGALPGFAQGKFDEEFRIVRMDLKVRWVQFRTFPVRNTHGEVYRAAAIAEDITDRKQAEEQLAANARQLQVTVEEQRSLERELRDRNRDLSEARVELENRVRQRTADLTAANTELQRQIGERKRLEVELLEIAENERRRIGFDLHDDIGQKLMGVSLLLKAVETRLAQRGLTEVAEARQMQELIADIVNHTHNLAHCFSALDSQGGDLKTALEKLITQVRKNFAIGCRLRFIGKLPEVTEEMTQQIYKIAQESVSNAVKHGHATLVLVSVTCRDAYLTLRIKNDGVPFPDKLEPHQRMGLRIMNYRARTLNGTFEIKANGNNGTIVCCTVPILNNKKVIKHDLVPPIPPGGSNGEDGQNLEPVFQAAS